MEGGNNCSFDALALDIFQHQSMHNPVYARYLDLLKVSSTDVKRVEDIPCLPIRLFKHYDIKTGDWDSQAVFKSSGTADILLRSQHHIRDMDFYHELSSRIFKSRFPEKNLELLALLPSYIESGQSSLVEMTRHLMQSYNDEEAFYMYDFDALGKRIRAILTETSREVVLIGVSFALLDFAAVCPIDNSRLHIIFTGGMKNRQVELQYEEMYAKLKAAFPSSAICSEYGMTEMFSQAYSKNGSDGRYTPGKSLKVFGKQLSDPLSNEKNGRTAQLAFVDLGNIDSLSFVLTDDLCRSYEDGSFEILGRLAQSDLRGCNMLYYN